MQSVAFCPIQQTRLTVSPQGRSRSPGSPHCLVPCGLVYPTPQVGLDDTTRATLLVHTLTALPSLEPRELALSIWALGRITASGLAPALIDLDTSSRVLDTTLARLRGGAFGGGELQQLLEGLTRLALQPPLEWMQAYVAQLKPKLATLEVTGGWGLGSRGEGIRDRGGGGQPWRAKGGSACKRGGWVGCCGLSDINYHRCACGPVA